MIHKILAKNAQQTLSFKKLQSFDLKNTQSQIVKDNHDMLFGFVIHGLEGLFRKDVEETRIYGRRVCDLVKVEFNCSGFFTSDELPRYGITKLELTSLYQQTQCQPNDGNLIVLMAYDEALSTKIRDYLIHHLEQEFNQKP